MKVAECSEGLASSRAKFDFEPRRARRPDEGWIGFGNHSENDTMFFKELSVEALKQERLKRGMK